MCSTPSVKLGSPSLNAAARQFLRTPRATDGNGGACGTRADSHPHGATSGNRSDRLAARAELPAVPRRNDGQQHRQSNAVGRRWLGSLSSHARADQPRLRRARARAAGDPVRAAGRGARGPLLAQGPDHDRPGGARRQRLGPGLGFVDPRSPGVDLFLPVLHGDVPRTRLAGLHGDRRGPGSDQAVSERDDVAQRRLSAGGDRRTARRRIPARLVEHRRRLSNRRGLELDPDHLPDIRPPAGEPARGASPIPGEASWTALAISAASR